jgi:adenylate cyclase
MIEVKGKTKAVRIYELVSENEKAGEDIKGIVALYGKGVSLFYEKRFSEARDAFRAVLLKKPGDGPSEFNARRCEDLINAPQLTDGWDVVKMTEK